MSDHGDVSNSRNEEDSFTSAKEDLKGNSKRHRTFPWLQATSHLFFLFGSILYVAMTAEDLVWSNEARDIPKDVLIADDDLTWINFRARQDYEEAGGIGKNVPNETGDRPSLRGLQAQHLTVEGSNITSTNSTPSLSSAASTEEVMMKMSTTGVQNTTNATASDPSVYNNYFWHELPQTVKTAYETLGWNEELWDSGGTSRTDSLSWDALTKEEQEAADFIGYTQQSWDNPDGGSDIDAISDPSTYTEYWWDELPPRARTAWETLGWNKVLWNAGGKAHTENLYWEQLSDEERQAAIVLGYTQESWDDPETAFDYVGVDDDYVFVVDASNTWVSRYMILYFSAAFCFVVVGLIDLIREKLVFHCFMILAGVLGVISAMLVEKDLHVSNIFNCLSVHFFFLEAFTLFGSHKRYYLTAANDNSMQHWLSFADFLFGIGALLDVILSYFWLQRRYNWNVAVNGVAVFASILWVITSLVYATATLVDYRKTKERVFNIEDMVLVGQDGASGANKQVTSNMSKPKSGDAEVPETMLEA